MKIITCDNCGEESKIASNDFCNANCKMKFHRSAKQAKTPAKVKTEAIKPINEAVKCAFHARTGEKPSYCIACNG